jgi:polysaccharide deacetylase family protein (PEP-CTERM system associated)
VTVNEINNQSDMEHEIKNIYLFSVDLEDVRFLIDNGLNYAERVPLMTEKYLSFLDEHFCKTTFFVVGDVAKAYPELINRIIQKGHEIACHTNKHIPLVNMNIKTFQKDIAENMKILYDAGVKSIYGFRAPMFSITEKTLWVYKALVDLGFVYSSSVLPAKSPLFGWPEFGRNVRLMENKIWELPISLFKSSAVSFPYAGGIYFRLLPFFVTKNLAKKAWKKNQPVIGYAHPYDIDQAQEHFMHPGISNNKVYNKLMYINRGTLLKKAEKIVSMGGKIIPYIDYVNEILVKKYV